MSADVSHFDSALAQAIARAGEVEGLSERDAAVRALAIVSEAGLTAFCVPAEFGGAVVEDTDPSEVSVRAVCTIRERLAHASGMLDVMLVMQGLGSYSIARGGQPSAQKRWLGPVARGEAVAAFALTEPQAGSDLGSVSTRATRVAGGWTLSGQKTFISNAGIADFYSVLARTSGEPGDGGADSLSMFVVPADSQGLTVEPFEVIAPHPIGEVHFDGVSLPDEALLGEIGGGLALALGTLGRFRTSVAAAAVGFARRALEESMGHLQSRQQFGRPLSKFQGLRFELASMDLRLRAAQLLVEEAARAVDRGEVAQAAVARAKLEATEAASWICDRAVQHHGGLGVRRGSIVERLFREVRALRIYEGTSEVQKLILARELLSDGGGPRPLHCT